MNDDKEIYGEPGLATEDDDDHKEIGDDDTDTDIVQDDV
jgi:hypothetical protein